jgi:CheY-like chemotaxis protein
MMGKILLVEDDNNLREIYEARLKAEGYETSAAQDGEEALVVAKQAKPDLVISDVMMPKISGFEMLDILRNTPGLEHVKVIMLTALGQAEDRQQADSLGADKYLVKSQVTLEDIVKTAHELLDDELDAAPPIQTTEQAPATEVMTAPPSEVVAAPAPTPAETAVAPAPEPPQAAPEPAQAVADDVMPAEPAATPEPTESEPAQSTGDQLSVDSAQQQVTDADNSDSGSAAQEEAVVKSQIDEFLANQAAEPAPTPAAEVAPGPEAADEPAQPLEAAAEPAPAMETPAAEPTPTAPESPAVVQPDLPAAPAATDDNQVVQPTPADATSDDANTSSQDDQLMADAANQLAGGQPGQVATPNTDAATVEAEAQPAPSQPARTGGNKVIQPLNNAEKQPDINELLAREEATNVSTGQVITSTDAAKTAPAPPTGVPLPTPAAAPQSQADEAANNNQPAAPNQNNQQSPAGFDPSNIAL